MNESHQQFQGDVENWDAYMKMFTDECPDIKNVIPKLVILNGLLINASSNKLILSLFKLFCFVFDTNKGMEK